MKNRSERTGVKVEETKSLIDDFEKAPNKRFFGVAELEIMVEEAKKK